MQKTILFIIESHHEVNDMITLSTIPESLLVRFNESNSNTSNLRNTERETIIRVLNEYGNRKGAKAAAAKALGISVATLYRKLKIYSITD